MAQNNPLQTTGINMSELIQQSLDPNSSELVKIGMFPDEDGNLRFTDDFVREILGRDSVSLQDLYNRVKGIYSKDGQLFFKDSTLSRPYSLEEIVGACRRWKESLMTGSLWWLGRTQVDHSECANLPRRSDPTGPLKVWSVDRFLSQLTRTIECETPSPLTFYEKTTDPRTGEWRWWDVPGLELVIPPVEDAFKVIMLFAKLSYISYNSPEPIIFRIYDYTAGKELARSAVVQANESQVMYPVPLSYFGPIENINECVTSEGCGCVQIECVDGDDSCLAPDTGTVITKRFAQGSHLLKVQFHVLNYQPDHWERVFGVEVDDNYVTTSTIDAVMFDINPNARYTRKHNTVRFSGESEIQVTFDQPLLDLDYAINLSCSKNINVWYDTKTTTGFVIKSEVPFNGFVDWTIINLNPNLGR